jgi:pyruvate dehydrogenase E2 component (dihydrolipoamide acetyltransferase)
MSSVAGIIPGWSVTAPVLNSGQCYIGQPGNIVDRPVVRDGVLVPGKLMTWSYNFDHRLMDGAPVCLLHTRLKEYLEHPELMLA